MFRGVIWDEGGRSGGSCGVSMDIQGGHLGCPWTYRGLSGLSRGRGRRAHQWPEYGISIVQCSALQCSIVEYSVV